MAINGVTHARREWLWAAALCLLTFAVYWLSLAPTITWQHDGADSGDLATAVAVGGVPHPSGYPTYLAMAELFRSLPLGGDVAYRLNLMSAVCAAAACVAALATASDVVCATTAWVAALSAVAWATACAVTATWTAASAVDCAAASCEPCV